MLLLPARCKLDNNFQGEIGLTWLWSNIALKMNSVRQEMLFGMLVLHDFKTDQ
jgi:hypothetical protein